MEVANYRFALGRSNMEDMAACGACPSRERRPGVEDFVERRSRVGTSARCTRSTANVRIVSSTAGAAEHQVDMGVDRLSCPVTQKHNLGTLFHASARSL